MRSLIACVLASCLLAFPIDLLAASGRKPIEDRQGAADLIGRVLAETQSCPNTRPNMEALDRFGRAYGLFFRNNKADEAEVRSRYEAVLKDVSAYGMDCRGVIERYGDAGHDFAGLVTAEANQKPDDGAAGKVAEPADAKKTKLLNTLGFVLGAAEVCQFKPHPEGFQNLAYKERLELFDGAYDMKWVEARAKVQYDMLRAESLEYRVAFCRGIRMHFGPGGSEIADLLE